MLKRNAYHSLINWKTKSKRKPLVLRGARQVGKTTLIKEFSSEFSNFIDLNLEKDEDRVLFEKDNNLARLLEEVFFQKQIKSNEGKTLIFIDEIQQCPEAVAILRYFYEERPDLYVIAAGSLLESVLDKKISFPVGRVEYMSIYPMTFSEFLLAKEEKMSHALLDIIPFPKYGHQRLIDLFKDYTKIGGMPEVVDTYINTNNLTDLNDIYNSLLVSYLDDVEKYSRNNTQTHIIRHCIASAFKMPTERIKYQNFGKSSYRSREVSEAFRLIEKAYILKVIHPITSLEIPALENKAKSPKLLLADTGLVNFSSKVQDQVLFSHDIAQAYNGKIAEHIAGQELSALHDSPLYKVSFWVNENRNNTSEIDFVYQYKGIIFPIEVKSGATGRLRSLFEFMDTAPHHFAVRVYSGELLLQTIKTIRGKKFTLLNLPFYLINKIESYLDWMIENNDSAK